MKTLKGIPGYENYEIRTDRQIHKLYQPILTTYKGKAEVKCYLWKRKTLVIKSFLKNASFMVTEQVNYGEYKKDASVLTEAVMRLWDKCLNPVVAFTDLYDAVNATKENITEKLIFNMLEKETSLTYCRNAKIDNRSSNIMITQRFVVGQTLLTEAKIQGANFCLELCSVNATVYENFKIRDKLVKGLNSILYAASPFTSKDRK